MRERDRVGEFALGREGEWGVRVTLRYVTLRYTVRVKGLLRFGMESKVKDR